jgi:putative transposase
MAERIQPDKLTTGSAAMLGLHSDTLQAVCKQFVASRNLHRRRPRWRGKKSLGWVPFAAARAIRIDENAVIHLKRRYHLWLSRPVDTAAICAGSFAPDARGRWYLNLQVEAPETQDCGPGELGYRSWLIVWPAPLQRSYRIADL